jgi:hypothetical protein
MDTAKIGIDLALLTSNTTLITEAYSRLNDGVLIQPGIKVDGIKPDGSFSQHGGLLYNGNYGKDLYVPISLFMPTTNTVPVPMTFSNYR